MPIASRHGLSQAAKHRGPSSGFPAHPFTSLVESTQEDVPDVADSVLADDGSLTFLPDDDASNVPQGLSDTAPLRDPGRLVCGEPGLPDRTPPLLERSTDQLDERPAP